MRLTDPNAQHPNRLAAVIRLPLLSQSAPADENGRRSANLGRICFRGSILHAASPSLAATRPSDVAAVPKDRRFRNLVRETLLY